MYDDLYLETVSDNGPDVLGRNRTFQDILYSRSALYGDTVGERGIQPAYTPGLVLYRGCCKVFGPVLKGWEEMQ